MEASSFESSLLRPRCPACRGRQRFGVAHEIGCPDIHRPSERDERFQRRLGLAEFQAADEVRVKAAPEREFSLCQARIGPSIS